MGQFINYNKSYGLQNPLQGAQSPAIVASRNPTTADSANPGQFWLNKDLNAGFLCLGSIGGAFQWGNVTGTGGVFANLTVNPGPTLLTGQVFLTTGPLFVTGASDFQGATFINNAGAAQTSIGNVGSTVFIDGNVFVNNAVNASTRINTGASTGDVIIGNAAFGTGVSLFASTAINISAVTTNVSGGNLNLNNNAGGDITNISTNGTTGAINIGNAAAGKLTVETGAAGIEMTTAGDSDVTATGDNFIRSTTGQVLISGGNTTNTSVEITNSTVTGGVTITAGTSGMVVSSTNTTNNAIAITANSGAGGITITGGTGTTTVTSAGTTRISSSAVGAGVVLQNTNVAGTVRAIYNTNTIDTGFTINNGTTTGAIYVSDVAPAFAAFPGSICIRTGGANNNQVLYVNFDGGAGNWAPLTI